MATQAASFAALRSWVCFQARGIARRQMRGRMKTLTINRLFSYETSHAASVETFVTFGGNCSQRSLPRDSPGHDVIMSDLLPKVEKR